MEEDKAVFVVDASFVCSYFLGESNKKVEEVFEEFEKGRIELVSSTLLDYEVGNVLKAAVLRKRIKKKEAEILWRSYLDFEIKTFTPDFLEVFHLALELNLTFYDASYLYLAKARKLKLLTLDKSLSLAFKRNSI